MATAFTAHSRSLISSASLTIPNSHCRVHLFAALKLVSESNSSRAFYSLMFRRTYPRACRLRTLAQSKYKELIRRGYPDYTTCDFFDQVSLSLSLSLSLTAVSCFLVLYSILKYG